MEREFRLNYISVLIVTIIRAMENSQLFKLHISIMTILSQIGRLQKNDCGNFVILNWSYKFTKNNFLSNSALSNSPFEIIKTLLIFTEIQSIDSKMSWIVKYVLEYSPMLVTPVSNRYIILVRCSLMPVPFLRVPPDEILPFKSHDTDIERLCMTFTDLIIDWPFLHQSFISTLCDNAIRIPYLWLEILIHVCVTGVAMKREWSGLKIKLAG